MSAGPSRAWSPIMAQPNRIAPQRCKRGNPSHAAASTTGVAAAVNAVVAITVMAAAVAAIAAVMIDGGWHPTPRAVPALRCMAIQRMAPGPHARPTSAVGTTP